MVDAGITPHLTVDNMPPQKQHTLNESQRKEYETLYNITIQLYSRHKKLRHKYNDLERKHNLMKAIHAHLKQELLTMQQKATRQVDAAEAMDTAETPTN